MQDLMLINLILVILAYIKDIKFISIDIIFALISILVLGIKYAATSVA